jgi:serine/threonine protein kinase
MVFAELLGLTPFLPGQSDIDQLARMQHVLGSITPQAWPAVEQLPDWHKVSFAHSPGQQLSVLLPDAPPIALNLLQQLIRYNPDDRLTTAAALQHAYFACGSS